MTLYEKPSFSVPASGKAPENCGHGWIAKGRCILCGQVTGVGPTDTTSSRVSVPGGSARLSIPPQGAGVGAAKGSADASNPTVLPSGYENRIPWTEAHAFQFVAINRRDLGKR